MSPVRPEHLTGLFVATRMIQSSVAPSSAERVFHPRLFGMAPRHTVEDVQHEAAKAGAAAARAAIKSIELPTRVGAISEAVETVVDEIRREADRLASSPAYGPDLAAAWHTAALEACRAELILLNAVAEKAGHTEH